MAIFRVTAFSKTAESSFIHFVCSLRQDCFKKRGELFQIKKVDSTINPPLYTLIDLMKDEKPGHYYREQLIATPAPNFEENYFEVEKVISEKKVRGKKYFLVKFLYYPDKFNEYIPEENMKIGNNE